MTVQDILANAAERAADASKSDVERRDILNMVKVFAKTLSAHIRDHDVAGVLVPTYIFRGARPLGAGVVLTLGDRVLMGWMKGLLKKPVVETVPLASITKVEGGTKGPGGRLSKETRVLIITAAEQWELLCSPDVPKDAPLYEMLAGLLDGSLTPDQLGVPAEPASGS